MDKLKGHVSDDLLNKLGNINHHYIESENPEHHWNFLECKDQTVLDLGCGFHLLENGWLTTPHYFLSKGAKKVIGVDPACGDIEYFKNNLHGNEFYCDFINSLEKLEYYIKNYSVSSLKMDIEGYEKLFLDSNENFDSLKHVAIETHSKELLNETIKKLIKMNFKINTVCTFYPRVYDICNLIYASR